MAAPAADRLRYRGAVPGPPDLLRQAPSRSVLEWAEGTTGDGAARVDAVQALDGATTSAVHALRMRTSRGDNELVLRRYVWQAFLAEDPDRPRHEAMVLRLLESTPVPAPALVAVDAAGDATGSPAVLMTRLPGSAAARPNDWLQQAADAAARIHRVDGRSLGRQYRPYFVGAGRTPAWGDHALWDDALALAGTLVSAGEPDDAVFIHRDYHPGNLLWDACRLSGIVDWLSACCGPPGVDVAHFGINLALDFGPGAVATFRTAYEKATDRRHDRRRDVVGAIDVLPFYAGNDDVDTWPGIGLPDAGAARARLEAFLASALAMC